MMSFIVCVCVCACAFLWQATLGGDSRTSSEPAHIQGSVFWTRQPACPAGASTICCRDKGHRDVSCPPLFADNTQFSLQVIGTSVVWLLSYTARPGPFQSSDQPCIPKHNLDACNRLQYVRKLGNRDTRSLQLYPLFLCKTAVTHSTPFPDHQAHLKEDCGTSCMVR